MEQQVLELARGARRIEVFTGAGMSAESGLETYRDPRSGLWENIDPLAMASLSAWERDPQPMWAWYLWRAGQAQRAQPNAGHLALPRLARCPGVDSVAVTTQNIDDLHERGGMPEVTHLHGSLFDFGCGRCGRSWELPVEFPATPVARLQPPSCPGCGGLIRPLVIWFGERLPDAAWNRAEAAMARADLVIIVGTSGVVQPAASLPVLARQRGIPILEISPSATELSPLASISWRATAASALPRLVQLLENPGRAADAGGGDPDAGTTSKD